jgi:hypothetical protein
VTFASDVADPERIHRQIDLLAARADGRRLDALGQDGVSFTQLLLDRETVVALLSRALRDASYRPGSARIVRAFIAGKWREMARLGVLDLLVHGVLSEVLGERLEPLLSPRVYSYRSKRSPWHALRLLARVARVHCAQRPDPRTRGLYVLRSDVHSYAPTIPLDVASRIWPELREVCGLDAESPHWRMVHALVTQELLEEDGTPRSRARGVLFGAPSSNALMNMYLMPLDVALAELGGACARFGDDVLFAHADPSVVRGARTTLERILGARGLSVNPEKMRVLYWNGAARPSLEWPEAAPVSAVTFLGASIGFDGTIGLSPIKWRAVLRDLRARIVRTARLVEDDAPQARARILASMIDEAFELSVETGLPHKQMVTDLVSDRRQLAQLDYWIARWIAEAATGKMGPRALRWISPGWLRREAGLTSRVVARNRGRGSS